jgi:catechol 2,3-dioxygenase-like lactoylglutathione lyase family enzyme
MNDRTSTVLRTEHTGLTVASIDSALDFWTEVLGFQLVYRKELGGGHAMEQVVGVSGAYLRNALLEGPDGYRVELIEYDSPEDRVVLNQRPCDVGSAHLTFVVTDLHTMLNRMAPYGWRATGEPQTAPSGTIMVYTRGPDGHTIELMQHPQ